MRELLDALLAQTVRALQVLEPERQQRQQVAQLLEAAVSLVQAREQGLEPSSGLLPAHNILDTVDDDASRSRPA